MTQQDIDHPPCAATIAARPFIFIVAQEGLIGVIADASLRGAVKAARSIARDIPAQIAVLSDAPLHPEDVELGIIRVPKTSPDLALLESWARSITIHDRLETAE